MARIDGVDVDCVDPNIKDVFVRQIEKWGVTLEPYEIYARRPSLLHAVLGMWEGLKSSGLLDGKLTTLINRRVAALNGCRILTRYQRCREQQAGCHRRKDPGYPQLQVKFTL